MYSLSKLLSLPLVILAAIIFFYAGDGTLSIWIFLPVLLGVALYVFHGPIDYWGMQHFPPKFDPKLLDWLIKNFPQYNEMFENDQKLFQNRLVLYIDSRLFQSVGSELRDVPFDIKAMISAHAVLMGLHHKDLLIGDFDRIFLYKHPFYTPDKKYLHTVETNTEDGVIILSLEQAVNSILSPKHYYNIVFHAYAEAYIFLLGTDSFGDDFSSTMDDAIYEMGFSPAELRTQLGEEILNPIALHITFYFAYSSKYREKFPFQARNLDSIFKNSTR
ncbi:MAG: zinc-dependent peptidase [Saprospiraceae bacterium]